MVQVYFLPHFVGQGTYELLKVLNLVNCVLVKPVHFLVEFVFSQNGTGEEQICNQSVIRLTLWHNLIFCFIFALKFTLCLPRRCLVDFNVVVCSVVKTC